MPKSAFIIFRGCAMRRTLEKQCVRSMLPAMELLAD